MTEIANLTEMVKAMMEEKRGTMKSQRRNAVEETDSWQKKCSRGTDVSTYAFGSGGEGGTTGDRDM